MYDFNQMVNQTYNPISSKGGKRRTTKKRTPKKRTIKKRTNRRHNTHSRTKRRR
jgi:hypothetical protein